MKRQKYDIFISYRRDGGQITAKMLHDKLKDLGYQVFFDVESLRSGDFNEKLYSVIDECKDFLLVLSPGSLDRCKEEKDWVRLEIEHALKSEKNIIPIMLRGFDFPDELPESIKAVSRQNGLKADIDYYDAFISKLQVFLETAPVNKKRWVLIRGVLGAVVIVGLIIKLIPGKEPVDPVHSDLISSDNNTVTLTPAGKNTYHNWLMADQIAFTEDAEKLVFGKQGLERSSILSITFQDTLENMPEEAWDVSENGDGFVKAWVKPGGETRQGDQGYDLYIAAKGTITARSCEGLFACYDNVTEIRFNHCFSTEYSTNMKCMFYKCSSLETLDLSDFNTEKVTDMYYMFTCCNNLKNLNLSNFDTSQVAVMENMFGECSLLEELDVSHFDTKNTVNMRLLFAKCYSLKEIDVSSFDTGSVTEMSGMFSACSGLESMDLSSFDTHNVANMSAMFYECSSLKSLDLSGFDTGSVVNMSAMFCGCKGLETLDLSSFDTGNTTDMSYMFFECSTLKNLDLSGFDTNQVVNSDGIFYHAGITEDQAGFSN